MELYIRRSRRRPLDVFYERSVCLTHLRSAGPALRLAATSVFLKEIRRIDTQRLQHSYEVFFQKFRCLI
jgi:hypothetical protein